LADLDGDGEADLVSGSWPGDIHFFKGLGKRAFAAGKVILKPAADVSNPQFAGYSVLQSSSPWAVDWDGDGDVDLVVGMIWGKVFLLGNTGTKTEPKFADPVEVLAGGKSLQTWLHKAGPCVADWDGDGLRDLVIGDEKGVHWCRNVGTAKEPAFAAPEALRPGGNEFHEGYRFKPCVADWNGDGLLDLVVGTTFSEGGSGKTRGNVWVALREKPAVQTR
jgi:hypothetical protein